MIDRFNGQYDFLSNFYHAKVQYRDEWYDTNEHAFQAAKCTSDQDRRYIQVAYSPREAKRRGRLIELRGNWEQIKDAIMLKLVRRKFDTHSDLRKLLLATKQQELIEGNVWGDIYWGVCDGQGQNKLGKILMQVRSELQGE